MKFEKPTLFIDPSYTMSGLCFVDPNTKVISFGGISRAETKKDLQHYYQAAQALGKELAQELQTYWDLYSEFDVVMEAPFPGSFASSGLYMLQTVFLLTLKKYRDYIYSLSPSYISAQIKKECSRCDSTGIRKRWCNERVEELRSQGWGFSNLEQLKKAGADAQTAFGFYWFLSHSDKELEEFKL